MSTYLTKTDPLFKLVIFFLCVMSALTQAGLVLYTPAFVEIGQYFQIDPAFVKITLTAYLLGFSISQLFYGPLADRFGRKKVLLTGMIIFTLASLWSTFTHTYQHFVISRALQGLGVGACMTISRALLRDCFDGRNYIYAASFLSAGFAFGLGLSPVIGGHLLDYFSWRSEFVCLATLGVIMTFIFARFLPETHAVEKDKDSYWSFFKNTLKNYLTIFKNARFMCYLLGGVMAYGVVITFTVMGPFLFVRTMHFSAVAYGWLTLLVATAYYASTYTNRKLLHRISPLQMIAGGLCLILLAGIAMLIPAFLFHSMNIYAIVIPLLIATYGQAFIWSNTIALALKDLSHMAGTASGLFNFLQMLFCSLISAFLAIFADKTQVPLGCTILALGIISAIIFYTVSWLDKP